MFLETPVYIVYLSTTCTGFEMTQLDISQPSNERKDLTILIKSLLSENNHSIFSDFVQDVPSVVLSLSKNTNN